MSLKATPWLAPFLKNIICKAKCRGFFLQQHHKQPVHSVIVALVKAFWFAVVGFFFVVEELIISLPLCSLNVMNTYRPSPRV